MMNFRLKTLLWDKHKRTKRAKYRFRMRRQHHSVTANNPTRHGAEELTKPFALTWGRSVAAAVLHAGKTFAYTRLCGGHAGNPRLQTFSAYTCLSVFLLASLLFVFVWRDQAEACSGLMCERVQQHCDADVLRQWGTENSSEGPCLPHTHTNRGSLKMAHTPHELPV